MFCFVFVWKERCTKNAQKKGKKKWGKTKPRIIFGRESNDDGKKGRDRIDMIWKSNNSSMMMMKEKKKKKKSTEKGKTKEGEEYK